jgi:hypothetical protein
MVIDYRGADRSLRDASCKLTHAAIVDALVVAESRGVEHRSRIGCVTRLPRPL